MIRRSGVHTALVGMLSVFLAGLVRLNEREVLCKRSLYPLQSRSDLDVGNVNLKTSIPVISSEIGSDAEGCHEFSYYCPSLQVSGLRFTIQHTNHFETMVRLESHFNFLLVCCYSGTASMGDL